MDIWELTDLATPWAVHLAATLDIGRHITNGTDDVNALASATDSDPAALRDLLDHLAAKDVLTVTDGRYALTPLGEQFRDLSPFLRLDGIAGRLVGAWPTLPAYVRTGLPAYQDVFGRGYWADLAAHPDLAANFDAMMGAAGHGRPVGTLPLTGGWDSVRTVADVGGGTGAFLAAVLEAYPHLDGVLVDQASTIARANLDVHAGRVKLVAGDFFSDLPRADVYLLSRILNDWPDAETVTILSRCAEAGGESARVLVLGGVVPDDEPRPLRVEAVLVGGRTDRLARFAELAGQAGLEVASASVDEAGRFVVECEVVLAGR